MLLFSQFPVFFSNLDTSILALGATNTAVLLGSVAAEVVIADAVVYVDKRDIGANVALVLAPESRKHVSYIGCAGCAPRQRLFGGKGVEVCAGCCARFVRAVGAIASVVVDSAYANLNFAVADAAKVFLVLVMG